MSLSGGLSYERYVVGDQAEWLARVGPDHGIPILILPPLFEEMNRTRAFLFSIMRGLAVDGFRCCLPDLPGTGESRRALGRCSWTGWTSAISLVADQIRSTKTKLLIASFRGGALLTDSNEAAHWRLAPVNGAALIRDLDRSGLVGGHGGAGYSIPPAIASALSSVILPELEQVFTVRLASDPKPADAKLDGPALWRRSEPANSTELAQLCASNIEAWARKCGIC